MDVYVKNQISSLSEVKKLNNNHAIDSLINNLLNFFKKKIDIDNKQEVIIIYALRLVINSIIAYTLSLIPALVFGTFKNVLIISLSFAALRTFSGGAHSSSIQNCSINGAIISNILGLMTKHLVLSKESMFTLILFTFLFSLWAIGKFAPADTPSKPIATNAKKETLRKNSFIVLCLWALSSIVWFMRFPHVSLYIYASTIGILWQSFTLTKTGYKLYRILDNTLNKLFNIFQKKEDQYD